jgi:hypothetical protein
MKGAAEGFDLEEVAAVLGHGPVDVDDDLDAADAEVEAPMMKLTMPPLLAKKKTKSVSEGEDDHLLSTPRQTEDLWSFGAWAGGVRAAAPLSKMMVVAMDSCGVEGGGARWRSSWWAGWVVARISSRLLLLGLLVLRVAGAWRLAGGGWRGVRGSIVVRLVGLWRGV